MKDQQQVRRPPVPVIAGLCGLVLAVGGGIAWWTATQRPSAHTSQSIALPSPALGPTAGESPAVIIPVPPPSPALTTPPQSQTTPNQTAQTPLQQTEKPSPSSPKPLPQQAEGIIPIYWLKETGQKLEVVPAPVKLKATEKPDATLVAAFDNLLAGPTEASLSSAIPKGTTLRSLNVKGDSIYIDLSKDFTTGGGTESMIGRLGQVIYTATSFNPNANVWISVEGKPLEVLGGEGLEVAQPTTRQIFEKDFAIE